jgi:DNA invertase Pin-like site-specific DNA recombinase
MLKRFFDPWLTYRVVVYLRMSSDKQNPRSPDQQLAEIRRRLKALGYNWRIVKIYRDDAISGRLIRKRVGYQEMMRDIKSGAVVADLIVVDTIERFGRVEDLPTIRKELYERQGVLVVTSDSNFADPTTPQGKALGAFEAMRASEDGCKKAHDVLRGKLDAVLLKHWPGGTPPFGLKGRSVMKIENGREKVDYCLLEPDPSTRWIMELLFELAEATAFGSTRLAKQLNANPDIPDRYKPFQPSQIDYWLDHEIYYGELVFPKHSTGIVDDVRVVEPNAEKDILRVPEFCEPLVPRARWDRVQAIRQARRQRHANARRPRA